MTISRFIIAGILNTAITYLIYLGLLLLMPYIIAYTLTYIIGIVLGYLLNAKWVFKKKPNIDSVALYPLAYVINYLLGTLMLWLLVNIFELPKEISPLIIIAISVPLMYVLTKNIFHRNLPCKK